jgi:hypothetical protein
MEKRKYISASDRDLRNEYDQVIIFLRAHGATRGEKHGKSSPDGSESEMEGEESENYDTLENEQSKATISPG